MPLNFHALFNASSNPYPILDRSLDIVGANRAYATQQAIDAPSALEVEQGMARLDLLITDVGLPSIDGRQLAEMMRERRPGLKVLFITGYAHQAGVRGEFLGERMDMLAKPFTIVSPL